MTGIDLLRCPSCRGTLAVDGTSLRCAPCAAAYPIRSGVPVFAEDPATAESWSHYADERYGVELMPLQPYYASFGKGWKKALDVGGGDGSVSAAAAAAGSEVWCVNPGVSALERLQRRGQERLHPVCAFAERLPFADGSFDGAFLVFVIEHIADPLPALREIRRVLKPGGELLITTDTKWYDAWTRSVWETLSKRRPSLHHQDPTHINLMVPRQLRRLVAEAGFELAKEEIHYLLRDSRLRWVPQRLKEDFFSCTYDFVCRPKEGR